MLICHCQTVNDRTIRAAVLAGARQPEDLARLCGAGGRCGGCLPALLKLLDDAGADPNGEARTSAA